MLLSGVGQHSLKEWPLVSPYSSFEQSDTNIKERPFFVLPKIRCLNPLLPIRKKIWSVQMCFAGLFIHASKKVFNK